MRLAALTLAVAALLACSQTGDDGGAGGSGGSGGTGGPACVPTAPARVCEPACLSGHYCWDFEDHDPYCGGQACTGACCRDADCIAYYAGHANAANARCGADHLCDPIAFGGSFFCAAR